MCYRLSHEWNCLLATLPREQRNQGTVSIMLLRAHKPNFALLFTILNHEYLKTVYTMTRSGTVSLACHRNIVLYNMAMVIWILNFFFIISQRMLFSDGFILTILYLSETVTRSRRRPPTVVETSKFRIYIRVLKHKHLFNTPPRI